MLIKVNSPYGLYGKLLFSIYWLTMLKLVTTKFFLIFWLLFVGTANAELKLKTYKSGYFSVEIPHNFTVTKINDDEATFTSPDQKVEFFVYSPLRGGKPELYLDVKQNEKEISEKSTKTFKPSVHRNHIQNWWKTLQDKNGRYTRSFMYQRACHGAAFEDCFGLAFGIKYKNKQAYNQYKQTYIAFKKSLQQFADH